jgi:hypothetical protein
LAGRSLDKARRAAEKLNGGQSGGRVYAAYADASDPCSLRQAFAGMGMVVVASRTTEYVETVARSVIEAKIDDLDEDPCP